MLIHSPKELALFVANQRKKNKLSQISAADSVGLKQKTISAFENKPESTKLDTLFNILAAVNLEIRISPKNENITVKTPWQDE